MREATPGFHLASNPATDILNVPSPAIGINPLRIEALKVDTEHIEAIMGEKELVGATNLGIRTLTEFTTMSAVELGMVIVLYANLSFRHILSSLSHTLVRAIHE